MRGSLLLLTVSALVSCMPTNAYQSSATMAPPAASAGGSHYLSEEELAAIPTAFPTTFVPPRTAALAPLHARMVELENPTGVGRLISMLFELPGVRAPIVVTECGATGAYYEPRDRQITICYETIVLANRLAGKPPERWYTLDRDASTFVMFTALHEIGHALIHQLRIRVNGSEEDLVDQFAFLCMTNVRDAAFANAIVRAPSAFFLEHGRAVDANGGHRADDEHSAGQQRAFEGLCIAYGRHPDPAVATQLGRAAEGCTAYTRDVITSWNRVLAPYTRVDTGRAFSMQ